MFNYLQGTLVAKEQDSVVLDIGGIGFEVRIPTSLYSKLPPTGAKLTLFTHLHFREDGITIYGFDLREAKRLFTLATGVAGIGPRVALNILGTFSVLEFTQAVLMEDHGCLTRVPGIGPKTAKRLVLELKEKLRTLAPELMGEEEHSGGPVEEHWQEAVGALLVLGYAPNEAKAAIKAVLQAGDRLEDLVKKALKFLGER